MRNKRRVIRNNNRSGLGFSLTSRLAIVLAAVLIVFQIFTAIQTSSSGAILADLERTEMELIKNNQELQSQLVDRSSLISIREKSDEFGFYTPKTTFYINDQDTVALLK